jgi:hypothetical protein
VALHVEQAEYNGPLPIPALTAQWNVATPGNLVWYKWEDKKLIGTEAGAAPSTIAGPGSLQAWAVAKEDHVKVTNPLAAPTTVYSLLYDIRATDLASTKYRPLLQTKEDNDDGDADIFMSNKTIGLGSYSSDVFTDDTWHRIVVTVDITGTKQAVFYVDGQKALTKDISSTGDTDRFTLHDIFWVFLDDDNEDNPLDCARIAIWNTALLPGEVLSLGTAELPVQQ